MDQRIPIPYPYTLIVMMSLAYHQVLAGRVQLEHCTWYIKTQKLVPQSYTLHGNQLQILPIYLYLYLSMYEERFVLVPHGSCINKEK